MFRTLLCALLLCPGAALAASSPTAVPGMAARSASPGLAPSGLSITVQLKDTAYSLARKYNLSVDALLSINNLSSPDLTVGQVLLVSPPTYTVVRGDTAFSIARKNGLSVDALLGLNHLSSPDLKLGQVLTVRGAPGPVGAPTASVTVVSSVVSSITVTPALTAIAAPLPMEPALQTAASQTPGAQMTSDLIDTAPMPTVQTPPVQTTTASIITTLPADAPDSDWLANARSLLGVPYAYGGKSRSGTDCSGFVLQVFAPLGLTLPRVSADQAQVGMPVERGQLQSGDLVFFDTEGRGKVTHVGIVVEGNTFINANSFVGRVGLDDLGSRYWATRYLGARRVLGVMAASH